MIFCSNLSRQLWPTMPKRTCRRAGDSGRFRDLSPTSRRKNMMTGGFLSHRGTKTVIIHLYIDGFSHGNRHHSAIFWGTPMAMETSMTGNGSKVKTPQGQIDLNGLTCLFLVPSNYWDTQWLDTPIESYEDFIKKTRPQNGKGPISHSFRFGFCISPLFWVTINVHR